MHIGNDIVTYKLWQPKNREKEVNHAKKGQRCPLNYLKGFLYDYIWNAAKDAKDLINFSIQKMTAAINENYVLYF